MKKKKKISLKLLYKISKSYAKRLNNTNILNYTAKQEILYEKGQINVELYKGFNYINKKNFNFSNNPFIKNVHKGGADL